VTRGRTFFLTAATDFPDSQETIVSCLNFAVLEDNGFFVNWLVTSSELITSDKYGDQFATIEAMGGNWMRRNFAQFLLKTARLAVCAYLAVSGNDLSNVKITVQANTKEGEIGHRFYSKYGFEELGPIETFEERETVFQGFDSCLDVGMKSFNDFIHFYDNNDDIVVFRHPKTLYQLRNIILAVRFLTFPRLFFRSTSCMNTSWCFRLGWIFCTSLSKTESQLKNLLDPPVFSMQAMLLRSMKRNEKPCCSQMGGQERARLISLPNGTFEFVCVHPG